MLSRPLFWVIHSLCTLIHIYFIENGPFWLENQWGIAFAIVEKIKRSYFALKVGKCVILCQ